MSPDSPETRISRLEQAMAGLKQRVEDLSAQVGMLTPLIVSVAELKIAVSHIQTDMHDITGELRGLHDALEKREEQRHQAQQDALKDSRNWRRALVLGSFTVLAAVIGAVATVVVAVV